MLRAGRRVLAYTGRGLRRRRLAVAYAGVLVAGAGVLTALDASAAQAVVSRSSTNLAHLGSDPWLVLPASALWSSGGNVVYWVLLSVLGLGAAEVVLGWRRTLAVAVAVHVGATLLTQGGVWMLVMTGHLPTAARQMLDVGPSYALIGAAACALLVAQRRWLVVLVALLGWTLLPMVLAVGGWQVGDWGHLVSLLMGLGLGVLARARMRPETRVQGALQPAAQR